MYLNDTVPATASAGVNCNARPPSMKSRLPCDSEKPLTFVTVNTSPSGSVSFSNTGNTVVLPGRTP
nr:hypothetical protein BJQ95_02995 [Cryobacterium sp. SO1]